MQKSLFQHPHNFLGIEKYKIPMKNQLMHNKNQYHIILKDRTYKEIQEITQQDLILGVK